MSEAKKDSIFILLQVQNDTAMKTFQNVMKTSFPATHIICPMKNAVDMASKGKPALIKPPTPDALSLQGDLVSIVVHNWLANQQKKPVQKDKAKPKPNPKAKGAKQQEPVNEQTPRTEPEIKGPNFIYITDYPKMPEQLIGMQSACIPVVCALSIEVQAAETDKHPPASTSTPSLDFRTAFSDHLPILSFTLAQTGTNEDIAQNILNSIYKNYNAYQAFHKETIDVKTVTIPKYPPDPVAVPQLPVEKQSKKEGKAGAPSTPVQETPSPQDEALKEAYKQEIFKEISEFLKNANNPIFSNQFQHQAELLPKYQLPATLKPIFSHRPDYKDPFIFTMRSAAAKNKISYDDIFSVYVVKKFEELVGYPVGERRHAELIPLELLPNVIAPLIGAYPNFKWGDFAGTTLLAFFHSIPKSNFPVSTISENFHLPVPKGFGKWLEESKEEFPDTCDDPPAETEFGANAGREQEFCNLPSSTSTRQKQVYFDESGLKVESYPVKSEGQLSANFLVSYNKSSLSFNMQQRNSSGTNGEEEDDDQLEVNINIRGALSKNCDFNFEHSPSQATLSLFTKGATIISTENDTITMIGAPGEQKRAVTSEGQLIKFTPKPVIYMLDGSIETFDGETWHLIDSEGKAFVKTSNDEWTRDKANDATCETIQTHFTKRQVSTHSNGVSIINDEDETTIVYPDGSKYYTNAKKWTNSALPDVIFAENKKMIVENEAFKATFESNNNITIDTKDNECSMNLLKKSGHIIYYFGQFRSVMTMIDLFTGTVANAGARRCVYYLTEDWQWALGHQLCSKKEIVQHFQDGDFVERLQKVDTCDQDELTQIVSNGHKPRLFVITNDGVCTHVSELISASDFQQAAELSSSRIAKDGEKDVMLWFDTEPKSYREMQIWTKMSDEEKNQIIKAIEDEKKAEELRVQILDSVGDPKWRELETKQKAEEDDVLEFLKTRITCN